MSEAQRWGVAPRSALSATAMYTDVPEDRRAVSNAAMRCLSLSVIHMPPPTRVLIVKLGSLGDIVHAWPAYVALQAARPDWRLAWLVDPRWQPLVQPLPGLHDIFPFNTHSGPAAWRRAIARLRQFDPHIALDWQGAWKSSLLAWLSRAPRRLGLASGWLREPGAHWFYTQTIAPAGRHISHQLLELVQQIAPAAALRPMPGMISPADQARAQAWLREREIQSFLFFSPGGGWRGKQWPRERYLELGRRLMSLKNLAVVWNQDPGEPMPALPAGFHTFQGDLPLLMAVAARARLALGGDTGPLHLAAALGAPVVALFGPTDPERNRPWARHIRVLFQGRPAPAGQPAHGRYARGKTPAPELLAISVEAALAACQDLLAASAPDFAEVTP